MSNMFLQVRKKWILNSSDISPLFYQYCLISVWAGQMVLASSHELMILQINLIWSLINFLNDKSMSKIMKEGVIQCICSPTPISTYLSRDVLSEGQIFAFSLSTMHDTFSYAEWIVRGKNTDSFTSYSQTLVSTCYPFSCFLKLDQSQPQRIKLFSVPCADKQTFLKRWWFCVRVCVCNTCVSGKNLNRVDRWR